MLENSSWSNTPSWRQYLQNTQPHLVHYTLLLLGLSFFWSLLRHAGIAGFIALVGLTSQGAAIVLGYYVALVALSGLLSWTVARYNLWQSRFFRPLCLGVGLLAGLLLVPGVLGVTLPTALGYATLIALTFATSLLAIQCVLLVTQSMRAHSHTLLLCVFGSTLINIVETFLLCDVLALHDEGAVLYPLLASLFLYAASGTTAEKQRDDAVEFPRWTRGRISVTVGALVLVTLIKALGDTAFSNEGLRLTKHLVGILELSLILITISSAKGTGAPLNAAFYILLGSFVTGAALASMPASDTIVHAGIATITSARVLAEALVLLCAANLAAPHNGGVFKGVFLCFVLPEMLACAVGYGALPLVLGNAGEESINLFRCVGILSSAAIALGAIVALASHELAISQVSMDRENACQPSSPAAPPSENASMAQLAQQYDLTAREALIGCYLYRGYSVKRVSSEEGISINTVQSHSRNLYRKLGIHSRQELVELLDTLSVGAASR